MRIVFMGTPEFAKVALQAIVDKGYNVIAVYTQPDKEKGRGKKLTASPVKEYALEHNLPVYQPINFKNEIDIQELQALEADVLIVAAYGLILPQKVLDIPKLGAYNIHGSLLPQLRGASPIQSAILQGDVITGITIMKMELGLDSGPMVLQKATPILDNDTYLSLNQTLAELGAELVLLALKNIQENDIALVPQNDEQATYAKKILKTEGLINWHEDPNLIRNKIRAFWGYINSYSFLNSNKIIFSVPKLEYKQHNYKNGEIVQIEDKMLIIAVKNAFLYFTEIKPEGKAFISADAFYNGYLSKYTSPQIFGNE